MRGPNDYSLNKVARLSLQGSRKSGVAFEVGQHATQKASSIQEMSSTAWRQVQYLETSHKDEEDVWGAIWLLGRFVYLPKSWSKKTYRQSRVTAASFPFVSRKNNSCCSPVGCLATLTGWWTWLSLHHPRAWWAGGGKHLLFTVRYLTRSLSLIQNNLCAHLGQNS